MAALITTPRLLSIGGGALAELPVLLARLSIRHPLVVTDPFIARSGILDRATALLDGAKMAWAVFQDTVSDPTTEVIGIGVEKLREAPYDSLIAIGGGSPIDTAKGMSVLRSPARGDMYVELAVETPVRLTKKQKDLLAEFAAEAAENQPESDGFMARVKDALGRK